MSKKVNPTAVGMFVSGAVVFIIFGLIALGTGKIFEIRERFVVYFQSSANGLQEGSDVLFGGVKVGSVEQMLVQFDPDTKQKVIPVVIELSASRIAALQADSKYGEEEILSAESVQDAIDQGLSARLKNRSALTGQLFVDLDYDQDRTGAYTFPGETIEGLTQIPTMKSQVEEVLDKIAMGVDSISRSDIAGLVVNINTLVTGLNTKLEELDVKGISDKANDSLASIDSALAGVDLKKTVDGIDAAVAQLNTVIASIDADGINTVIDNASAAMKSLEGAGDSLADAGRSVTSAGQSISDFTDADAPASMQLNRALAEIDEAARSIRQLADFLRRNPNALVTGKKQP